MTNAWINLKFENILVTRYIATIHPRLRNYPEVCDRGLPHLPVSPIAEPFAAFPFISGVQNEPL